MTDQHKNYINGLRNVMKSFEDVYAPHIAIIDDCRHDRAELRNFVRAYFNDIPVRTYRDGVHFWESITEDVFPVQMKSQAIRAIFLDMNMPDMCGRQTLHKIKETPELANIPVYMMSKDGCPEKISKVLEMGANDFIQKPFDKLALSMLIQKGAFVPTHMRTA